MIKGDLKMIRRVTRNGVIFQTENNEQAYLFMMIAEHMNLTVKKYYWMSKFDSTVIEEIEPKIYDAYYTIIEVEGYYENINGTIDVFEQKMEQRKGLPTLESPLTEEEIKDWAIKAINHIFSQNFILK